MVIVTVGIQADEPARVAPFAFQPQFLRQSAELVIAPDMQQVGGQEVGVLLHAVTKIVPGGDGRQAQTRVKIVAHGQRCAAADGVVPTGRARGNRVARGGR
ncbi:hypothetical protein D3C72_1574980 [compost metagenome]